MKLSIVVPVYNAEKRIHILLDSVLCSDRDFEVVCINDGSTDNTVDVIKKYNDKRVKVITKNNEGTFKAWQYGIKEAKGDYVTILDQDDYIDNTYIDYILSFIDDIHADVLFTPYYVEQENGEKQICEIGIDDGLYSAEKLDSIMHKLLGGLVPYAKFTKVIKKDIIEEQVATTYDGQLRDFEDWLTMVEIFMMIESVYINNCAYYHYIQYSNSVSKSTISYRNNYLSLDTIITFLKKTSFDKMGEKNYNSFCFQALNILLRKCISIGEYDLAKEIVNMNLFHSNVLRSNLKWGRKFVFYTKSIWVVRLYRKIRRKE